MKNALFATTALVAAGFAGTAFAAEPLKASVHGYANVGVGFIDQDSEDADGFGVLRDGEVHVRAKGSSDNGLTFEFRFELEMFGSSDQVDENWAAVSGSFGKIMIGGNDTAMNELSAGVFYGPGAIAGYYDNITKVGGLGKSYGYDGNGVHYYTPNFSGFQAAVSFIPDGEDPTTDAKGEGSDGGADDYYHDADDQEAGDNIWSIGLNYTGEFDGVRVSASAGYSDADGDDLEAWSVGLELGAYGFAAAVHYEDNAGDTSDIAVGLKYSTGPWTVAGGIATLIDAPADEDITQFGAWVTYSLMKGASVTAHARHNSADAGDATQGLVYLNLGF